jgi:hypothetical protein
MFLKIDSKEHCNPYSNSYSKEYGNDDNCFKGGFKEVHRKGFLWVMNEILREFQGSQEIVSKMFLKVIHTVLKDNNERLINISPMGYLIISRSLIKGNSREFIIPTFSIKPGITPAHSRVNCKRTTNAY